MTVEEKLNILIDMEDRELSEEDCELIRSLLHDPDDLVRSQSTALMFRSPMFGDSDLELLLGQCDDADWLVRAEAYDVLSGVSDETIAPRLRHAIQTDKHEIARSYAITSWAETISVHAPVGTDFSDAIAFIRSHMSDETSVHCLVSCAYALYCFYAEGALHLLLEHMSDEDYHIRCSVVHHLMQAARKEDLPQIEAVLRASAQTDDSRAVTSNIEKFMKKYSLRPVD